MRTSDASRVDRPRRPTTPVLVLAWLLATALAGGIAWGAVSLIGGARGADGAAVLTQAEVAAALAEQPAAAAPAPTASPPGTAAAPPATESPPPEPAASQPPASEPPGSPPPGSQPPASSTTEPAPDPGPATDPPPPSDTGEVARTWDVTGGQVGAVCTGASIALLYATPLDGWTVEVERAGPERLEVRFSRSEDRSRVRAQCVGGVPAVEVEAESDRGDGGGSGGGNGGARGEEIDDD